MEHCNECGRSMVVDDNGVSHHVDGNEDVDYDADADHVPFRDSKPQEGYVIRIGDKDEYKVFCSLHEVARRLRKNGVKKLEFIRDLGFDTEEYCRDNYVSLYCGAIEKPERNLNSFEIGWINRKLYALMNIKSVSGADPHSSWGCWADFLEERCKIVGEAQGVTHYSAVNCNYILFPDGTLLENYSYSGGIIMKRIRRYNVHSVLKQIHEMTPEIREMIRKGHRLHDAQYSLSSKYPLCLPNY